MSTNFGVANDYNLFVLNNINMSNVDVEGRLAVGGNATLTNYGIGASISPLPPFGTDETFVVGGSFINVSGGTNFAGNTVISPSTNVVKYTMGMPNGSLVIGDPINFDDARNYLECVSTTWGDIEPNGSISIDFGTLTLTGTSNTFNIFTFDGTNIEGSGQSLSTISGINIVAPIGSTILINVFGKKTEFGNYQIFRNGVSATRTDAPYIVWNFPEATKWTNNTTAIFGSVLAPFATATTTFSQINGNVIFNNISGNVECHLTLFVGDIPVGICETTTTTTTSTTSTSSTSSSTTSTSTSSTSSSTTSTSTSSTSSSTTSTSTSSTSSSTTSTSTTSSTSSTTTQNPCQLIDALTSVIESIALEEVGIANILNAEGLKIQKALDIATSVNELVCINQSVKKTLENIIKSQMLLEFKLAEAKKILYSQLK